MDRGEFLLLSLALVLLCAGAAFFIARRRRRASPAAVEEEPSEWRRLFIRLEAVRERKVGAILFALEGGEGRGTLAAVGPEGFPLELSVEPGPLRVRIERPWLARRPAVRIRFGRTPWLTLKLPPGRALPRFEVPRRRARGFLNPGDFELLGPAGDRDWGLRIGGRLAALVLRAEEDTPECPEGLRVELRSGTPPLEVAVLLLALELLKSEDRGSGGDTRKSA